MAFKDYAVDIERETTAAVKAVRKKADIEPFYAIILGTGLGGLRKSITKSVVIPYEEIPGFAASTFSAHAGELVLGFLEGKPVVAMVGRFHRYEGYNLREITFPVRVMRALGAKILLVSNAAGGMRTRHKPGDLCIIEDHVNLLGDNPLIGVNSDLLGPRFVDMCEPYDRGLMNFAEEIALKEGIKIHRGVYAAVTGPNLETPAEYRYLRAIGCDLVGMSTVPEVIVAKQAGFRVLGISVITDKCVPDALQPADIREIIRIGNEAEPKLTKLFTRVIKDFKIN
jgi:purine-nucleoside phosphorylase